MVSVEDGAIFCQCGFTQSENYLHGYWAAISDIENGRRESRATESNAVESFKEFLIDKASKSDDNLWWFDTFVEDAWEDWESKNKEAGG